MSNTFKKEPVRFMLGSPVSYKAITFVARKKADMWYIPQNGNFWVPKITGDPRLITVHLENVSYSAHPILPGEDVNKSIVTIPTSGHGMVVGRERKQIGVTWREIEYSYFEPRKTVYLWVVKVDLYSECNYVLDADLLLRHES